jgi:L-asparaginase
MKILIVYTGGTIGCVGTPLSPMSGPDFERAFTRNVTPIVQREYLDCSFDFYAFNPTLDSTNMQPADWCSIAVQILQSYTAYDAFIVLHGTDSMAWTASALSFLLRGLGPSATPLATLTKPVIVTGAQLPLFNKQGDQPADDYSLLFNTDALQNVCGAVATAYAGIAEVGVYFYNTLMRGNRSVKTNCSQFYAFSSPNYPALAEYGVTFTQAVRNLLPPPASPELALDDQWRTVLEQAVRIAESISSVGVIAFPAFPAWAVSSTSPNTALIASALRAALDQGVSGLILESYGEGNFPSGNPATPQQGAIYQVLRDAHAAGVVIVDCTEVTSGTVNATAYAAGSWLSECGVIGASDMTSIASLAKLIWLQAVNRACGYGWSQVKIENLMQTNIAGEIQDIDRLDSRGIDVLAPGQSIATFDASATLVNDPILGPVLTDSSVTPPIQFKLVSVSGAAMPGRLAIAPDGTLTFTDRTNALIYRNTPSVPSSACMLVLTGESGSAPTLAVTSAATNAVVTVLYPPSSAHVNA